MNNKQPFNIEAKEQYTVATCYGKRSSLMEIITHAEVIFNQVAASNHQILLPDYRAVDFDFPMSDAFNLTKLFELKLQHYSHHKMAVVLAEEHKEFGQFCQQIGQRRGFNFSAFQSIELAEEWLLNK